MTSRVNHKKRYLTGQIKTTAVRSLSDCKGTTQTHMCVWTFEYCFHRTSSMFFSTFASNRSSIVLPQVQRAAAGYGE